MEITINGTVRQVETGLTLAQLIEQLAIKGPYAVELNKEVCPKRLHAEQKLHPGDILEIVTIVGGG